MKHILIYPILLIVALLACRKETVNVSQVNESYSATPVLPEKPYKYPGSSDDHMTALGRVLFYDKNLSHNNSVSCGSCHQQLSAFCDNQQSSAGLNGVKTTRN